MNKFSKKIPGQFSIDDIAGPLAAKQKPQTSPSNNFTPAQNHTPQPSSSKKIKEMQQEIQSLASYIIDYAKVKRSDTYIKLDKQKPQTTVVDKGKAAILNWIEQNFLNAANINFDEDAAERSFKDENADSALTRKLHSTEFVQPQNLSYTLSQIGSPKRAGESIADGLWGDRTQNAVKTVYLFSKALTQAIQALEGEAQMPFKFDSVNQIPERLKAINNAAKEQPSKQEEYAGYVITYVQALKKIFKAFVSYAERSGLKSYIASGEDGQGPRTPLLTLDSKSNLDSKKYNQIVSEIDKDPKYKKPFYGNLSFKDLTNKISLQNYLFKNDESFNKLQTDSERDDYMISFLDKVQSIVPKMQAQRSPETEKAIPQMDIK